MKSCQCREDAVFLLEQTTIVWTFNNVTIVAIHIRMFTAVHEALGAET